MKPFAQCIEDVNLGKADLALGNLTITASREEYGDFTIPYQDSSLKVLARPQSQFITFLQKLWPIALVVTIFVLISGKLFDLFDDDIHNLEEGIFLTLTTMSTVGYGDLTPKTRWARCYAAFVMFFGILMFSWAIGASTSAFSDTAAIDPSTEELQSASVGTIAGSSSETYCNDFNKVRTYDTIEEAILALYKKDIDYILYDSVILEKYVTDGLKISDKIYKSQSYGVLCISGSEVRDKINKIIGELQ